MKVSPTLTQFKP